MCLLYLFISDNPDPDKFRVILANNRDEFWDRPTLPLSFWEMDPHCISGQDMENKEPGGTWLGMSKNGRIGVLLNILGKRETKESRGRMIGKFLRSTQKGQQYIDQHVIPHKDSYNGFHLLLLDISDKKSDISYYNNRSDDDITVEDGFCCLCNSVSPKRLWKKSLDGHKKFKECVKKWNSKDTKTELLENLEEMLKDKTVYTDDLVLSEQAKLASMELKVQDERSASFVFSPSYRYGTRTHSFILVDFEGHCEFIEKTLQNPVNPNDLKWQTTQFNFDILQTESKY